MAKSKSIHQIGYEPHAQLLESPRSSHGQRAARRSPRTCVFFGVAKTPARAKNGKNHEVSLPLMLKEFPTPARSRCAES
jgi:hypothetical protein